MRFTVSGCERHLARELTTRALHVAVALAGEQGRSRRA
jgi:hypothetical protein